MTDHHHNPHEKPGWADTKSFRNGFLAVLVIASVLALIAGFVPAWQNPHHAFDGHKMPAWIGAVWHAAIPIFFSLYGFAAFMFIVLAGQHLRKLVGRKENYYEERE